MLIIFFDDCKQHLLFPCCRFWYLCVEVDARMGTMREAMGL